MTDRRLLLIMAGVSRFYGARRAVADADLALAEASVTCLLGPSGSGKSTILRMIAGLEPVDAGTIMIGERMLSGPGVLVAPERRGVGLVFQDNAVFPHLDVSANVGFGLQHLGRVERRAQVAALLDAFHIGHLAHAWPHMLSGGEAQRVAIARALARRPALLLLDEPFSGLDDALRAAVRGALLADLRATGATVLIVTHDPEEAMLIADHLVLMADGRILQAGTPEDCYRHPQSLAAARLLGEAIVLPATASGGTVTSAAGSFGAPALADGPAVALLRPEHFRLDAQGTVRALVTETGFAGQDYRVVLDLAGVDVAIRLTAPPPSPGSEVLLSVDAARARCFPAPIG